MKRLLAIAALLGAPLSCVSNQGDALVRFLSVRAIKPGAECTTDAATLITRGVLDLSSRANYLIAPSVETNTFAQPIVINQEPFSGEGLSDITLNELVYSYEISDTSLGITLPAEETVAIYAVFRPETDPNASFMFMNTLGPGALKALQDYFIPRAPSSSVTIISTIKARGYLSGSHKTESNIFRFPTTVFASAFGGCPTGSVVLSRCGLIGQDGPISCTGG